MSETASITDPIDFTSGTFLHACSPKTQARMVAALAAILSDFDIYPDLRVSIPGINRHGPIDPEIVREMVDGVMSDNEVDGFFEEIERHLETNPTPDFVAQQKKLSLLQSMAEDFLPELRWAADHQVAVGMPAKILGRHSQLAAALCDEFDEIGIYGSDGKYPGPSLAKQNANHEAYNLLYRHIPNAYAALSGNAVKVADRQSTFTGRLQKPQIPPQLLNDFAYEKHGDAARNRFVRRAAWEMLRAERLGVSRLTRHSVDPTLNFDDKILLLETLLGKRVAPESLASAMRTISAADRKELRQQYRAYSAALDHFITRADHRDSAPSQRLRAETADMLPLQDITRFLLAMDRQLRSASSHDVGDKPLILPSAQQEAMRLAFTLIPETLALLRGDLAGYQRIEKRSSAQR